MLVAMREGQENRELVFDTLGQVLAPTPAPVRGDAAEEERHAPPLRRARHLLEVRLVAVERGRDLGADESAPDHEEAGAPIGEPAQPAVVVERAEVDDVARRIPQPARAAAGREQERPVLVRSAAVVAGALRVGVDPHDPAAADQLRTGLSGLAPDAVLRVALPQPLGQGRPVIRRVRLRAHHGDAAPGVLPTDPVRCRVGRHAAADDQIVVSSHLFLRSRPSPMVNDTDDGRDPLPWR